MQGSKMQYVRYLFYKRGSLINTDARTLKYKFTAGHMITTVLTNHVESAGHKQQRKHCKYYGQNDHNKKWTDLTEIDIICTKIYMLPVHTYHSCHLILDIMTDIYTYHRYPLSLQVMTAAYTYCFTAIHQNHGSPVKNITSSRLIMSSFCW